MCKKQIIIRRIADKRFTITVDGKTREGFDSLADCKEWVGCMQAHDLFKGYAPLYETNGELLPVLPTYEYPVDEPKLALMLA